MRHKSTSVSVQGFCQDAQAIGAEEDYPEHLFEGDLSDEEASLLPDIGSDEDLHTPSKRVLKNT